MARLIKIKHAKDENGMEIQHAMYNTGHSYQIHRWEESTGSNRIVEEIEYQGIDDSRAARTMAMGALDSLHHQTLHEIHGGSYTDKRGITWHWAASMDRYITIPEDNE